MDIWIRLQRPTLLGPFYTHDQGVVSQNDLIFIVVMVNITKGKEISTSLFISRGHKLLCEANLDQDVVFLVQIKNKSAKNTIMSQYINLDIYRINFTNIVFLFQHDHLIFGKGNSFDMANLLLPQHPNNRQPFYISKHVRFHLTFSSIFWHAHPWSFLFLVTFCEMKWSNHSFLNQTNF